MKGEAPPADKTTPVELITAEETQAIVSRWPRTRTPLVRCRDAEPLLALRGLGKTYATPVLQDVEPRLLAGRGPRGSWAPTAQGRALWQDRQRAGPGRFRDDVPPRRRPVSSQPKARRKRTGVQIVQQELTLIPTLSVAENLFLNRLPAAVGDGAVWAAPPAGPPRRWRRWGWRRSIPVMPTGRLGVGEQQLVEIARALSRSCRVLILDEPTAALSAPQVDRLFRHVARLRASGVAIIYISHRLDEVRRIADRISVLRDGRLVATRPASRLGIEEAVRLMVGTNPEQGAAPACAAAWPRRAQGEPALPRRPGAGRVSF